MSIIQYPHVLIASIVSESIQDDNGNWMPGELQTVEMPCRGEPNNSGRFITLSDGSQYVYSWVVYFPKGTDPIPDGTQVFINSMPAGKGNVIRFSKGQLNSRLWF